MNLFNGYCYSTIAEAANSEISNAAFASQTGSAVPVSFSVIDDDSGTLTFNTSIPDTFSLIRVYPECFQVGYQHNLSGLTLADVNASSWLVFGVFAAVWGIKILRRSL
jgi:hypothetical protein